MYNSNRITCINININKRRPRTIRFNTIKSFFYLYVQKNSVANQSKLINTYKVRKCFLVSTSKKMYNRSLNKWIGNKPNYLQNVINYTNSWCMGIRESNKFPLTLFTLIRQKQKNQFV